MADYEEYVEQTLKPAQSLIYAILHDEWRADGYWRSYRDKPHTAVPRPIQRIRTRIKRPESLLDKYERLKQDFPEGAQRETFPKIDDFLGARIITYFVSQLRIIDEEIRSNKHFKLKRGQKPRAYISEKTLERIGLETRKFELVQPKWSGYSSIHYYVRLAHNPSPLGSPNFELQVRTMGEETWAEIHHQLGYKPSQQTHFSVERQFRVIASHLAAIDDHFDFLYDRLIYLQSISDPRPPDQINAENFPRVLDACDVAAELGELDSMLRILGDYGITTVADFQGIARQEIVEAIGSECQRQTGQRATAFQLIAAVVHLRPSSTAKEAQEVVRRNLKLAELTRRTRGEDDHSGGDETDVQIPRKGDPGGAATHRSRQPSRKQRKDQLSRSEDT